MKKILRWFGLSPARPPAHCHVPLLAGRTATMYSPGGVVTGMVEHPDDSGAADGLFIEFVGVVMDAHGDEDVYEKISAALERAEQRLSDEIKIILLPRK